MSDFDALFESISPMAERMQGLQRQAAQQYKPVVDGIVHSGCRDAKQIEHTLDRLLDFCGHEPVLQLYKRLCRHCWDRHRPRCHRRLRQGLSRALGHRRARGSVQDIRIKFTQRDLLKQDDEDAIDNAVIFTTARLRTSLSASGRSMPRAR